MQTGATIVLRMETAQRMKSVQAKLKDASDRIFDSPAGEQFTVLALYLKDTADELARRAVELEKPAVETLEARKKRGRAIHERLMSKSRY